MNKGIEILIEEYIGTGESLVENKQRLNLKKEAIWDMEKDIKMKMDKQSQIKELLEDLDIDIEEAINELRRIRGESFIKCYVTE